MLEKTIMARIPEIIPVTDLRQDAAAILKPRGVVVAAVGHYPTRAAQPRLMLSVDAYEHGEQERELLRLLVRGEQEIAANVGHDLDEVLAEANEIVGDDPS